MSYFQVERGWMEHPIFKKEPLTEREAWLWLIEKACWKDTTDYIDGKHIILKRGQLSHSIRYMADAWQWNRRKTERFVNRLKSGTMIETENGTRRKIITICNYDKYQAATEKIGTSRGTAKGTMLGQCWDKEEEGKKERTISEDKSSSIERAKESKSAKNVLVFPDWLHTETWKALLEVRKAKKAASTDFALRLLLERLGKLREGGHDPTAVMQESIRSGWADVYPLKSQNGNIYAGSTKTRPTATHTGFEQQDYRAGTEGFEVA